MEWTDLHREAVARERTARGVAVTYRSGVADEVEDLVRRESACCAWLSLTTSRDDRGIRVLIESDNPDALPVIEHLAGVTTD